MPAIDLSILNQRQTPAFYADVFANRPAAGFVGRIFVSTNTFAFYRDNGTGWDLIGGPGTGTVTGSGAAGQVAFWSGSSLISGENNLWWDSTNNHFGINTNTPGTAADIHHDQSTILQLNQTTATNDTRIAFQNSGTSLWRIGNFYNSGANDLGIFDVVGNIQPVTVKKNTGQVLIGTSTVGSGKLVVASASSDNGIQIVGASAPSLRIDSAESGPTKRAGLGISTATNNFIQGSADRDFCIFNGSTAAASPILFGVYDAGTVNVQEAARISAARNLLVGGSVDGGQKLQVTGSTLITGNSVDIFTATGIGSSAASGLMRVISGGTSVALAVGQSNSTRYTGIGANFINVYNDDFFLTTTGAFPLSIGTNNTARLTISSTGAATFSSSVNLGTIANSSDLSLLNIKQSSTAYNNGIYIERGGERNGYFMYIGGAVDSLTFRRNYFGTQSDVMSLTRDGNVGIGTNTPTSLFTLQGNGVSPLVMTINSANPNCDIFMQSSVSANAVRLRNGADDFSVFTNGSQRTTVTSSGNLLIGTTTDAGEKLQVNGSARIINTIRVNANGTNTVGGAASIISNASNTYGGLSIVWGADGGGNIFSDFIYYSLGTFNVLASQSVSGSPAGRTYSVDGSGNLRLSMAAGTYTIRYQALLTS